MFPVVAQNDRNKASNLKQNLGPSIYDTCRPVSDLIMQVKFPPKESGVTKRLYT